MANQGSIANLKQNVNDNIYTNTTKHISGDLLNTIIQNVIDTLGLGVKDFINVNQANSQGTAYSDATTARGQVPPDAKKTGLVITYLLADGWYIDQFIGSNISGWGTASNWKVFGPFVDYLFNKYFVGNGMTYVEIPTYGLVPGQTYYLYLKNTNWSLPSEITPYQNKLAIDSVYNDVKTNLAQFGGGANLPNPIPFTIPANSDYLLIGGRATAQTKVEFYISGIDSQYITESVNSINEDLPALIGRNVFQNFNFVQGSIAPDGQYDNTNNECIADVNFYPISGKNIVLFNQRQQDSKYWKIRFAFYNATKTFISVNGYDFIDGYKNIAIPQNTAFIRVAISLCDGTTGQAIGCTPADLPTDGTEMIYSYIISNGAAYAINQVEDISKRTFNKYFAGNEMTYVEVPTYGLIPNHTYYLYLKNPNWSLPTAMSSGQNKLAIDSVYNSVKTNLAQFGKDESLPNPIPFTIPANSDYLLVGGRATAQTKVEFYISDIDTLQLKEIGNPLPLNKILGYSFSHLYDVTSGYGDAACYNGKIFQFIDGNEYVYVHNATDGTLEQTIEMPNPNSQYHNNSVSFGSEKYDANDEYPLLYASQENSAQNKCIVYRITGTLGNYEMTVVQTITFPTNAATGLYYHNCYIDTKNGFLILGGLRNSSWSATNGNTLQYIIFNLPQLQSGDITLNIADAIKSSRLFTNMPTTQGGFCKNGYLYQVYGVNAPQTLMIMDIANLIYCYIVNLTEEVGNFEPEGAFEYNDKLHIVFNGGAIYRMEH